ncbi:hypothetical protein TrRE_jg6375 [Triparma retinervis]|uniref:Uncharacterized protein n=1 Tax=Triparma retinervis TaxID=2557542 RepID=A0A9W7G474_9STRA|nr:hypothetical protein TrRE_jg6375 [Triparma retinervis]
MKACLSRHEDTSELVCSFMLRDAEVQGLEPLEYLDSYLPSAPSSHATYVKYPYCSWRYQYSQLSSPSSAWNVAFPDQNSVYQAMLVYFNKHDEFVLNGPRLPYVRYFSLQTYDNKAASVDSVRDYQVRTEYMSNSNVYSNATAGGEGEPNGAFDVRITPHGGRYDNNGFINELAALPLTKRSGFFFLFLRFYDPEPFPESADTFKDKMSPVMESCYGSSLSSQESMEQAKKWGWVCPPALKRTNAGGGLMQTLPYCVHGRDDSFKGYDQGKEPGKECMLEPNTDNNMFLPPNSKMNGEFRNKDATYLYGCAEQVSPEKGSGLWARLSGTLPTSTTSLYSSPYVGEPEAYDVRYISISSINRSPPSVVYRTFMDEEILAANAELGKFGDDGEADRRYVMWFGPDEDSMPEAAKLEGGIFVPWAREILEDDGGEVEFGDLIPHPGILYREILSQSQESELELERALWDDCDERLCCGNSPPACCRGRSHIQATMRQHYPSISYYTVDAMGKMEAIG